MEDRQEEEKRLRDAGLPAGENRVLLMKDRGEPVGCAIVGLERETLHLRKLSVKGYNFQEKPQGDTAFY